MADKRKTLLLLGRGALRAFALKWFLYGFKHSGRGFHGEIFDLAKYPSLKTLLEAEFNRVYDDN